MVLRIICVCIIHSFTWASAIMFNSLLSFFTAYVKSIIWWQHLFFVQNIQFPLEQSFPWILTEHMVRSSGTAESSDPSDPGGLIYLHIILYFSLFNLKGITSSKYLPSNVHSKQQIFLQFLHNKVIGFYCILSIAFFEIIAIFFVFNVVAKMFILSPYICHE